MLIGARIKRLRERKGLTQEYMAHALEMSQSNYHKIESDKTDKIDIKLILKMTELLEVSLSELLLSGFHVQNNQYNHNGILIQQSGEKEELLKAKEEIIRLQAEKITRLAAEVAELKKRLETAA